MPASIEKRLERLEAELPDGPALEIIVVFVERRADGWLWQQEGYRVRPDQPMVPLNGPWHLVEDDLEPDAPG